MKVTIATWDADGYQTGTHKFEWKGSRLLETNTGNNNVPRCYSRGGSDAESVWTRALTRNLTPNETRKIEK